MGRGHGIKINPLREVREGIASTFPLQQMTITPADLTLDPHAKKA